MSIVADFEADYWSAGWEIPGRQRDDWGDEGVGCMCSAASRSPGLA